MLADGDGEADIHLAADDDQGVGIEAAVGPHRELSPGPSMAHPAHGLPQEVGGAAGGVGPAPRAAETSAPLRCRRRWPAAGDSPAGQCNHGDAPPPWPVRRSRTWSSPGRWSTALRRVRSQRPRRPGQQLPAHPIQLADVAPPEAAQESSQGGWRLDYTADGASCPAGTQHVGVVNEVAPSQRRGHQGQQLVSRVRPPRRVSQVRRGYRRLHAGPGAGLGSPGGAAQHWAPGGGRQTPIWMRSGWLRGSIYWVLLVLGSALLFQNHYPRFTGAPSVHFRTLPRRPPSVDSG